MRVWFGALIALALTQSEALADPSREMQAAALEAADERPNAPPPALQLDRPEAVRDPQASLRRALQIAQATSTEATVVAVRADVARVAAGKSPQRRGVALARGNGNQDDKDRDEGAAAVRARGWQMGRGNGGNGNGNGNGNGGNGNGNENGKGNGANK